MFGKAALMGLALAGLSVACACSAAGSGPVFLEEGASPPYKWGMLVHRDHGRGGGKRPCIVTVVRFKSSLGLTESDDTSCGPLPRGGPPDIGTNSFGDGDKAVAIFTLAFEPRVASVRMDLGDAGTKATHLKLLNRQQAKNAGVQPFRFRTFAIRGKYCLGSVFGYDVNGRLIYSSPPEGCP
jgi:hypothetical protein